MKKKNKTEKKWKFDPKKPLPKKNLKKKCEKKSIKKKLNKKSEKIKNTKRASCGMAHPAIDIFPYCIIKQWVTNSIWHGWIDDKYIC